MLTDAIGDSGYSEEDLREALAGVSSVVWQSGNRDVRSHGVNAVAMVIGEELYLVLAGAVICLVCGLLMRWERLGYGRHKRWRSRDLVCSCTH
jgi:hypothetical protein